jgi:hypothetical protein
MKFTTNANVNGTSLQGYVKAYYHELVERFGEPEYGGDKTTVEWCLEFEDGTVATIYDWKEYDTPTGSYNWHIGGKSKEAVWAVTDAMKETV